MPGMSASPLTRRELFAGASALAVVAVVAGTVSRPLMMAPADFAPFIDCVSEILLPGSRVTQPGAYLASVLPRQWRGLDLGHVKHVSRWLNHRAQGDFQSISLARRQSALTALDTAAFDDSLDADTVAAWMVFKKALLTAYYTSQKGGSHDLAFNLVPGRWDADIPLTDAPHPLSNDWLAIWFS